MGMLAAGVMAYEIVCDEGELLSEGVDEWLAAKPILTRAVIAALALHLGNALPVHYDVVSLGFLGVRKASRHLAFRNASVHPPGRGRAKGRSTRPV
jgi:hypothetical protein